jgi:hypothetical protein
MDYTTIEILAGIVTIVGFMYKFERDIREDIGELKERLGRVEDRLNLLVRAFMGWNGIMTSLVGQLEKKGVLEDANLLKTALRNMTNTTTNPLTSEERRRLVELIDKDELTPEEADELARLARRFYREYAGKVENAWLMLYYAAVKRGVTYRKYNRELTPILD